ncbi:porin [Acidobacteriota bacterium]
MRDRLKTLILVIFTISVCSYALMGEEGVVTKTSKFSIGGRLQTQYQFIDSDPSTSRFLVRRARLSFGSVLTEWASIKIQFEAGKQSFTLKDAYLRFDPKGISIFVGQKHVPFSREAMNSSKYLQMVERSLTSEFAPFRQMGVGVQGFALDKKVEYQAGVYNGAVNSSTVSKLGAGMMGKVKIYHVDTGASSENNKFLIAGRIDFHPFGTMKLSQSYLEDIENVLLGFGINFLTSDDSPSGGHTPGMAQIKKSSVFGGDAALKWKGFAGTFEYLHRDFSWWDVTDLVNDAAQDTFTVQGGYMLIPKKVEVTARYEFLDFDKDNQLLGPMGQLSDKWITFGINCFFEGHHTKIQLNYIMKDEEMPADISKLNNNTLLAQFAYYF